MMSGENRNMGDRKWIAFPHDAAAFNYKGRALEKNWPRLHQGDCEPFPSVAALQVRLQHSAADRPGKDVVSGVQEAWRAYHAGDFQHAHQLGMELGTPGFAAAIKAVTMYASYLETGKQRVQQLLLAAAEHAEEIVDILPKEPNAHYLLALTLGRYSQGISILQALAQGMASRIETALQRTLKLAPRHADAHTALGLYHAEIIGKLGALAAGLSYGVNADTAIEHFRKALRLNPEPAIHKLEYARGLRLIDADAHADQIDTLLHQAAKCTPLEAVELLDVQRAKALLK